MRYINVRLLLLLLLLLPLKGTKPNNEKCTNIIIPSAEMSSKLK